MDDVWYEITSPAHGQVQPGVAAQVKTEVRRRTWSRVVSEMGWIVGLIEDEMFDE